jgi:NAD(P)-dependent dehydrogenase (short-subunit alcohol dehydrogenase family)
VLTGSGGAMGAAIATRFAEEGADVVPNDRLPRLNRDTEQTVRGLGRGVMTVVANVTRRDDASRLINATLGRVEADGLDVPFPSALRRTAARVSMSSTVSRPGAWRHGYRGSPRTRSPTMLRWISLAPP